MNATTRVALLSLASVLALSACGGGGSDSGTPTPAPATKAEGVYGGTLTGSTNDTFRLLVLENDEYWGLAGITSGGTFNVYGLIEGQGTSNAGSFNSSNAMAYSGTSAPVAATVASNYVAATSVAGTITSPAGVVSFSSTPLPAPTYNYNTAAVLSTISGSWNTTALNGLSVPLTIAANGAFTALASNGCSITGTISPRPSGKNVFNVSLTFGPAGAVWIARRVG